MSLTTKIGVALFLVMAAALSMTTMLNYLRFEQTLRTLMTQRINVVANETSQDLRAGMDLGLNLQGMENLDAILERRVDMSPEITRITVLDCRRTPIATTSRLDRGDSLMAVHPNASKEADWIDFEEQVVTAGTMLHDSLGQCAGLLQIEAAAGTYQRKLGNAFVEMWKSASVGMLAIIPVLGLLIVLMRRRHRVFTKLHEDLDQAKAGMAGKVPLHDGDLLTNSEMELVALYREVRNQLPEQDGAANGMSSAETKNR